jgi:hypothetical protein
VRNDLGRFKILSGIFTPCAGFMARRSHSTALFVGLVHATGTDLTVVARTLQEQLEEYKYKYKSMRLIELLYEIPKWRDLPQDPVDKRIESHMNAGNEFRAIVDNSAALALLGVGAVRNTKNRIRDVSL